jgi:hypothetical protein
VSARSSCDVSSPYLRGDINSELIAAI